MNICLISREYPAETAWGGIGRYTYYLAHGLSKIGCNVHVVAQSLDYDKEYCDNGVFVHRIAHPIIFTYKTRLNEFLLRIEYSYKVYKKVKEIIEKYNIDIVESPNLSAEGFIYSLYKKTPLVTRLHTHFREVIKFSQWKNTYDRYLSCLLEDALILRSDLITCSTYKHKNLIFEEIGFTHKKTEIIPLGVPLPNLNKVNHMKKSDEFVVLYVGRLERRKGIHILFKSIPYVLSDFPNTRFIIIGRDTYLTEDSISFKGDYKYSFKLKLIQSIPEKYLENITFLDYVEDEELNRYYSLCDIFVAPSLYESFGFIYIEAMSYGKPVIGTSVGGIQEIIQDGINGILVPPEDHILLAEVIINLISDKDLRENLGFQARKTVEDKFNLNLMVKRTVEVYRNLLK